MAGLDNKISNIIGTKLPNWIINQLGTRSIQNTQDSRDNNNLVYLGNKSCWVRLVSSIDIDNENDRKYFKDLGVNIEDKSSLAKEFILFGGTSKYLNANSYKQRSGLGKDGAYGILGTTEIQKYGYKPMPGITGINIDTQGRLGSIRAANINFKCWDKNQLDIIDALYFKLGFTMFLEWGHTEYYLSPENSEKQRSDIVYSTELLSINPFQSGLTKEKIFSEISKNSRKSEGNYDAMLGIVTNFNFTYTQDGGYDCTLRLMSLGVLGDSIKINNAGSLPDLLEEEIKSYNSTLAEITAAQQKINEQNQNQVNDFASKAQEDLKKQQKVNDLLQPLSVGYLKNYYSDLTKNEDSRAVFNTMAFDSNNSISEEAKKDFKKWLQNLLYINRDYVVVPSDFGRIIYKINVPGAGETLNLVKLEDKDYYDLDYYISKNETYILGKNKNRGNVIISNTNTYSNVDINLSYLKLRYLKYLKDKNILDANLQTFVNFINTQNLQKLNSGINSLSRNLLISNESIGIGSSSKYIKFAITYTSPSVSKDISKDAYFFNIAINHELKDQNGRVWQNASDKQIFETLNDIINSDTIKDGTFFNSNPANGIDKKSFRKLNKGDNNDNFLVSKVLDTNLDSVPNYWYFSVKYKYKTNQKQKISITPREAVGARTSTGALVSNYEEKLTDIDLYLDVIISFNDSTLIQSIKSSNDNDILRVDNPTDQKKSDPKANDENNVDTPDPNQIKQALASQSSLELILRTIEVHALNKAINRTPGQKDLEIGRTVYVLEIDNPQDKPLGKDKTFLQQIFSNGVYSKFISELVKDQIIDTGYNTAVDEERFKIQSVYGFATSLMAGKANIDELTKVSYSELMRAYVVPYQISQEIIKGTQTNHPVYIPLGLLLMILNHCCTIYDTNIAGTFQTPLIYIDYNNELNFCLTNNKQLSTNPWKTLIPFEGTIKNYRELFDESILEKEKDLISPVSGSTTPTPLFNPATDDYLSGKLPPFKYKNAYTGKVMNVLLNIDYVVKLVQDNSYRDGSNNVYLKPFIEQLLSDINKYLGNFNSFRLSYNDQGNTFQIVDDQFVPSLDREEQLSPTNTTEIPLVGKNSIAKSLEIKTDISTKLANMIAISSNSTFQNKSTLSTNGDNFGFINTNYIDRYIPDKLASKETTPSLDTLKISAMQFNQSISDFYSKINPSEASVSHATNYYIDKMSKIKNNDFPTRASALIPVSINFSTDGIGGISMGQAFSISNELLPYTYITPKRLPDMPPDRINNVGFVIVGLTHRLDNNQWNTEVRANMIFLKEKTDFKVDVTKATSNVGSFGVNTSNEVVSYYAQNTNFVGSNNEAKKAAETYLNRAMTDLEWSQLVAATYAEAGQGEQKQSERAWVMAVILNRTRTKYMGAQTITDTLTRPFQFQAITGTKKDPVSSPLYISGPNPNEASNIYGAATNILSTVPKSYKFFTSNIESAYKEGTNIKYRTQLLNSSDKRIIGDSIFSITG